MASKSKRARLAPARNLSKSFKYWAIVVFVIKLIIIFNIDSVNIQISGRIFPLDGIWLGADGENYITGYDSLAREGIYSQAGILNYWPAGYPLLILLLSLLGKSWVLTTLSIAQSLIFSFSAYLFAAQLTKTRLKKFAYISFILIIFNPTLSLSSIVVGYESLLASGFLVAVSLIIKDILEKTNKGFVQLLIINSLIFGLLSFIQPRMLLAGLIINFLWAYIRKGHKIVPYILIATSAIILLFPATLIYRNNKAVGINSISTNLGSTMNIGAGENANGGYMQKDYGVPCKLSGTASEQDSQRVRCVLKWYATNPAKATVLFYKKSVYFWSPWINNGFAGEVFTGTMSRNPWLKISPVTNIGNNPDGSKLVYGAVGHIFAWLWLIGGVSLLVYGYLVLYRQKSLERFIGNIALIVVASNWAISLISIGDHRFRIPIMGMSLFLQAIGLKTLFSGGKAPMVDGPALR